MSWSLCGFLNSIEKYKIYYAGFLIVIEKDMNINFTLKTADGNTLDHTGFGISCYEKIKKKEINTKSGGTVDITSPNKYYGFEALETPSYTPHDFTLADLIPRDHRFFSRWNDKEKLVRMAKSTVMIYRWWNEQKLPDFFYHLGNFFNIDENLVKKGRYKVFMRISQLGGNVYNRDYFTTAQAQMMINRFKLYGILTVSEDPFWSSYHYDEKHPDMSFPKGYIVNVPLLLSWMRAVNDKIIKPFKEKFGEDLRVVMRGDQDINGMSLEKLVGYMEIYEEHTGKGTRRVRWGYLRKKHKLGSAMFNSIYRYLNAHVPHLALEYIEKNHKEDKFSELFKNTLRTSAESNKRAGRLMEECGMPAIELCGSFKRGVPTFRAYSELCSLRKTDGAYKDFEYKDRMEVFKKVFGFQNPKEYDCANSVHADNTYLMTGRWLEEDLYTKILPPLFKEKLMKNKEWFAPYRDDVAAFEEFFNKVTFRGAMKRLSNVVFSRGTDGGLWNYLFVRMEDRKNEYQKRRLKLYAETFAEAYFDVCGDSLRSYIYNVESYKMLHMAEKILDDGYKVALIYDCLITDKEIDDEMMTYLYRSAMVDYKKLNQGALKELKQKIKRERKENEKRKI